MLKHHAACAVRRAADGRRSPAPGAQAMKDERAEFTLTLSSRPRVRKIEAYKCTRWSHFCPTEQVDVGNATLDTSNPILVASSATVASRPAQLVLALVLGGLCSSLIGMQSGLGRRQWLLSNAQRSRS